MKNEEQYGRALLHNHTIYSDGLTKIKEFFDSCQTLGIDVALISDHDTFQGALEAIEYAKEHRIKSPQIIAAIECSYALWPPLSHIVFAIPPGSPIIEIVPYRGLEVTIADALRKNPKIVVILPHPAINVTARRNPERFLRLVNTVETSCKVNSPDVDEAIKNWIAGGKKIGKVSGADTHFPHPYDKSWNYITLFPGKTAEDLIRNLRDGTTIPFTDNKILYPPTLSMRIAQSRKSLIDPLVPVIKEAFRSFRR